MTRPESLVLRPARLQDARAMAHMSRDLIEAGLGWRYTQARMTAMIRDAETMALVACDGELLAGFAVMQFFDEHTHLNLLCVQPSRRRRGIGRQMMAWLEASARVAGVASIALEVRADNLVAFEFYRRLGFAPGVLVPAYYEDRVAARRMQRLLRQDAAARR